MQPMEGSPAGSRSRLRAAVVAGFVCGASLTVIASPAGAASTIGQTFTPASPCNADQLGFQAASPGDQYNADFDGVITSWSFQAAPSGGPVLKLKVGRSDGGGGYLIVGESALVPTQPGPNSFATRIPDVRAGDIIGFYQATSGACWNGGTSQYAGAFYSGDASPGTVLPPVFFQTGQLDISAQLERDADNDGFGDETQDGCPADASIQGACPDTAAPDTQITEGPNDNTKKKSATFQFTSEPGASFECSFDGGAFAACTPPYTVKAKKGKHNFSVRAIDPAGNADASPASDDWKVKKKNKK